MPGSCSSTPAHRHLGAMRRIPSSTRWILARHAERRGCGRCGSPSTMRCPELLSAATAVLIGLRGRRPEPPFAGVPAHHVAEPCATRDCRAVWHAGIALPGPHRFGSRAERPEPDGVRSPRGRSGAIWPRERGGVPRDVLEGPPITSRTRRSSGGALCARHGDSTYRCGSLGSSLFGALFCGRAGLPYAFASRILRRHKCWRRSRCTAREFRPSATAQETYVMLRLQRVWR